MREDALKAARRSSVRERDLAGDGEAAAAVGAVLPHRAQPDGRGAAEGAPARVALGRYPGDRRGRLLPDIVGGEVRDASV